MFILVLLVVLMWLILTVFLAGWTLFLQGYLYTEPTPGLTWRGPAAGGALTFVLVVWLICDYQTPGAYRPLWEFSSTEETKPFPELRIPAGGGEEVFKPRPGTRNDYHLNGRSSARRMPDRPPQIVVIEGDKKSTFKPERDEKGHFKQASTTRFGHEAKEPLRYLDESGRVMIEGSLGQLTIHRSGRFIGNVVLNLLFLAACFLALWLLLHFQWAHALGQAFVLWAIVLLFAWPPILSQAEETSRARSVSADKVTR